MKPGHMRGPALPLPAQKHAPVPRGAAAESSAAVQPALGWSLPSPTSPQTLWSAAQPWGALQHQGCEDGAAISCPAPRPVSPVSPHQLHVPRSETTSPDAVGGPTRRFTPPTSRAAQPRHPYYLPGNLARWWPQLAVQNARQARPGDTEDSTLPIGRLPAILNPDFVCGGGLLSCPAPATSPPGPLLSTQTAAADYGRTSASSRASSPPLRLASPQALPLVAAPLPQQSGLMGMPLFSFAAPPPVSIPQQHRSPTATAPPRLPNVPYYRSPYQRPSAAVRPPPPTIQRRLPGNTGPALPQMVPQQTAGPSVGQSPVQTIGLPLGRPICVPVAQPLVQPPARNAPKKAMTVGEQLQQNPIVDTCGSQKRRFVMLRKLGKGGCGEVYLGQEIDISSNQLLPRLVALKCVTKRREFRAELGVLETLRQHYITAAPTAGPQPSPLIAVNRRRKILVMEYLAESLAQQFERCRCHFSLKTILMLAVRMIELSTRFYYQSGYVHVDIKPSNFCTGRSGCQLQLIDFGYSSAPGARLPGPTGTPLFMSHTIQTMASTTPTLQDDLESIGYVIMFLLAGGRHGLPWGQLTTHQAIAARKTDAVIDEFCASLSGSEYEPVMYALQSYLTLVRNRQEPFDAPAVVPRLLVLFTQVLLQCGFLSHEVLSRWSLSCAAAAAHLSNPLAAIPPIPLPENEYDWILLPESPPLSSASGFLKGD